MRKNEERMKALDLPGLTESLDHTVAKAKPAKQKGVSAKKRKTAPPPPGPRRTTRSAGMSSLAQFAGGVATEDRGGRVTLVSAHLGSRGSDEADMVAAEPVPAPRRYGAHGCHTRR